MKTELEDSQDASRHFLVTGGLGFIGVHLCQTILARYPGCKLTIVDNLSSTKTDYSRLLDRADIHIMDLRQFAPGTARFTDVFHLASPVGSLGILERHGHIATDILELAHCASELAGNCHARLLYLSSSEVYGRDGKHAESAEQIVPVRYGSRMEYALGKLTAEHVLLNLADSGTHQLRIVRPFNVVGPWQDERLGFVVPQFFKAALANRPLPVHGDGMQTRSFCDVQDLVAGLVAVNEHGHSGATYNVGNPNNLTTIKDLASRIIAVCESESDIEFINPQDHFGKHYLEAYNKMPVIDKATKDTQWRPIVSLDDVLQGLKQFYCSQASSVVVDSKSNPCVNNDTCNKPDEKCVTQRACKSA